MVDLWHYEVGVIVVTLTRLRHLQVSGRHTHETVGASQVLRLFVMCVVFRCVKVVFGKYMSTVTRVTGEWMNLYI